MGQVVQLNELNDGIVVVTMEDRNSKNTFSQELSQGLIDVFERIKKNDSYKVVILTGYENYFCCGGTKEELYSIYKGDILFNDLAFFMLPFECPIPVISAMQGHAIGGGLVFGLYSDFSILGLENMYAANFMRYGFTPGMAGTYLLPLKLGSAIGTEMLFTADNYSGKELKERGALVKIVPKAEVLNESLKLANSLAEKPRLSLITLKEHLNWEIKQKLPEIIKKELYMHSVTLNQPEVEDRIKNFFGQ